MVEDIEIYIRDCSTQAIIDWLESVLGPLELIGHSDAKSQTYWARGNGSPVPIVITERVTNSSFASIWINSGKTPWSSDLAFARAAFIALGSEVLCDPGILGTQPYSPSEWWRISAEGEGLVVWNETVEEV